MNKYSNDTENEKAKVELTQWYALELLAKNNDLAGHIEIAGMSLGVCNTKKLLPAIKHNINEIKKFLKGEANEWE